MTADALKSQSITNLDAFPVVANTTGNGALAHPRTITDNVTPTAAGLADTGSKYKVLRVPTNIKLQSLRLNADSALDTSGSPTLKFNVGAYYSDSTVDGTPAALQGTAISATAFASQLLFTTTYQEVNALGNFSNAKRQKELWDALGLSSNPGGMFDIVVAVQTAAATGASASLSARADCMV